MGNKTDYIVYLKNAVCVLVA